jgi:hypothetical protein
VERYAGSLAEMVEPDLGIGNLKIVDAVPAEMKAKMLRAVVHPQEWTGRSIRRIPLVEAVREAYPD